ncbi:hypothetical protein D3C85_896300 [compost metagenome]
MLQSLEQQPLVLHQRQLIQPRPDLLSVNFLRAVGWPGSHQLLNLSGGNMRLVFRLLDAGFKLISQRAGNQLVQTELG